jgi:lysophospholipase L1-like esterase
MFVGRTDAVGTAEPTMLALGDSITFGYDPHANPHNAASMAGYAHLVADSLALRLINAACPGEASGGFLSPTGVDNGCRGYRSSFPLHVSYSGTQFDFAREELRMVRSVRLVTIDLGVNDLLREHGVISPDLFADVTANLIEALEGLRATGYRGAIVVVNAYAWDYAGSAPAQVERLNEAIGDAAHQVGAPVADAYGAFAGKALDAGGSDCAAGLIIPMAPGRCDIHPTPAGAATLAEAVLTAAAKVGVEPPPTRN